MSGRNIPEKDQTIVSSEKFSIECQREVRIRTIFAPLHDWSKKENSHHPLSTKQNQTRLRNSSFPSLLVTHRHVLWVYWTPITLILLWLASVIVLVFVSPHPNKNVPTALYRRSNQQLQVLVKYLWYGGGGGGGRFSLVLSFFLPVSFFQKLLWKAKGKQIVTKCINFPLGDKQRFKTSQVVRRPSIKFSLFC